MDVEKDTVEKYSPLTTMGMSDLEKNDIWSTVADRIHIERVTRPHKYRWLVTASAAIAAVVIVGLGTYAVTHNAKVQSVSTATLQQHVKPESWNSTYWSSANPNFLSPELLRTNKSSLVVRLVGGNIPGGEKTERIELTQKTTTWSNGKMIPFDLGASSLKSGDNFTVITEKKGNQLIAKQIFAPDSQIYGIVQGVSGDVVTVKELSQTNFTSYTGRNLKLKFDRRTNFNGASPADLKPGYMVQSQVTGKYPGVMLMYGVQISKGKKSENGVMQWSSVGN